MALPDAGLPTQPEGRPNLGVPGQPTATPVSPRIQDSNLDRESQSVSVLGRSDQVAILSVSISSGATPHEHVDSTRRMSAANRPKVTRLEPEPLSMGNTRG